MYNNEVRDDKIYAFFSVFLYEIYFHLGHIYFEYSLNDIQQNKNIHFITKDFH